MAGRRNGYRLKTFRFGINQQAAFIGKLNTPIFHAAYRATGDAVFKERWQSFAAFLSRIQMRSADPRLDGCWCRGMDIARMEAYGMPHDVGWGPCSVESGWTVGEILMGLGYGIHLHMDE